MKIKPTIFVVARPGDIITFKGCTWNEPQWEFGCPSILYSPLCRYSPDHSLESLVEDACIDLCVDGPQKTGWSASELREFQWRGWSPRGFAYRRRATHTEIRVRFFLDEDGLLAFTYL